MRKPQDLLILLAQPLTYFFLSFCSFFITLCTTKCVKVFRVNKALLLSLLLSYLGLISAV